LLPYSLNLKEFSKYIEDLSLFKYITVSNLEKEKSIKIRKFSYIKRKKIDREREREKDILIP